LLDRPPAQARGDTAQARGNTARTRGNLDDVRALGHHRVYPLHGRRGIPRLERGISHDHQLMRLEDPPPEPQGANRAPHR
jgi:hypothetical protein